MCRNGFWKNTGDDVDLCGTAELGKKLLAAFPGQTERIHVRDADPGHEVSNGRKLSWIEFPIHQRASTEPSSFNTPKCTDDRIEQC